MSSTAPTCCQLTKPFSPDRSPADIQGGDVGREWSDPVGDRNSKRTAALLLRDLWRLTRRAMEFPNGDLTIGDTLPNAARTASDLADQCGGAAIIGRVGAGFSLNGHLLPSASLRFRNLHHALTRHNIKSITLQSPVDHADIADLATLAAGLTP